MAWFGRKIKAQSILEYATVIACLVAAILTMQVYIKRAMQGKYKEVADQFGPQYAPRRVTGNYTTTYSSDSITQSEVLSEIDLGYDLDGDAALESDVTATRNFAGVGTWSDTNSDGLVQPGELSGGTVTTHRGSETVGIIAFNEDLFDE